MYILLDIFVCSIPVYFYKSHSTLASPKGKSKYKWRVKIYSDTIVLCKKEANVIRWNLSFVLVNLRQKIDELSKEISLGSLRKTSELCSIFAVTKFKIANFWYNETKVQSIEVRRSKFSQKEILALCLKCARTWQWQCQQTMHWTEFRSKWTTVLQTEQMSAFCLSITQGANNWKEKLLSKLWIDLHFITVLKHRV